ncbi:F-box protein At5g07610-like [Triticum dicoccoides]|uniref:F-box protein At5g07610-like n=1 Tax=Triticum dicoccoides TaxID=85692 RepID=UPI00188E574D|nr:F-box protein At5g07610-like [Triticum dicoccoides]
MATLTDDILVDIILRLPYKSTCCCKCISKRWRGLISHRHHRKKMPQSVVGFFYEGYNECRSPRKARYFTNLSREYYPLVDPSLSFLPNCRSLDILDACNGLLLCCCLKAADPLYAGHNTLKLDYVVCNATTKKWVSVPATDWSSKVGVARLGFDPAITSHFHVFEFIDEEVLGISEDEQNDELYRCIHTLAIYSSKAGVWKYQTVEHGPFAIPKNSPGSFLNGILNLAAYNNLIVAVDVEGDNWSLVHIPKPPYYADDINGIFPSQGQLYFANSPADSDGSELSIWVHDDFVTGKWSLKHNVSHLQLFGTMYSSYANDYSVISMHPEHSLIFIVGGHNKTLMSYDMDSMQLCFICQLGSECRAELPGCGDKDSFLSTRSLVLRVIGRYGLNVYATLFFFFCEHGSECEV